MPSNEQTPLLQTVVISPPRQRYSHKYIRRFSTIALSFILIAVIILFLVPAHWLPGNHSESEWAPRLQPWSSYLSHASWPQNRGESYEELRKLLLESPKEEEARKWSHYYTGGPHLAGKNFSQALWTKRLWEDFGVQSRIVDYEVYINYPLGHRLALLEDTIKSEKVEETTSLTGRTCKVKYECSLEEDVLEEDPTSALDDRIPTFHGYGASGNVTARYVYINFGTYADFDDLIKANVSLRGNIALVKYGRIFRGLKIKRAQELGMVGVVMYTDPEEDGEVTEQNGYKMYPHGPARNPSSVQRGSVQFCSIVAGDPTTPGYPSKPGVPRVDPQWNIPSIPSLPISYRDALPILRALNGYGPRASDFNKYWQGGKLGYKGVQYHIGPSPPHLQLNLVTQHEYVITPLWNVIGVVNGTLSDEVVVLGNHRDAWVAGGAGDPNSGSAALNEIIRSFGIALKLGWKPLRTVVFASWDGEEYGLIGSTEWVEEFMPWLSDSAIAYLNVDVGVRGPVLATSASPLLNKMIFEATSAVQSPNQTTPNQSVGDVWDGHIATMGSGSDFTAFQDFAGIPSADMGFRGISDSPVYHYHSNYDSFAWMDRFGDKGWHYHIAITKVWALLAAALVETPIIGFNVTDYAIGLQHYLEAIKTTASGSPDPSIRSTSFPTLEHAIARLHDEAIIFDARARALATAIAGELPWWKWWQKARLFLQMRQVNKKYKYFERKFLYEQGLDGRSQFKHVVFAPGIWTGYSGATFPGLVEAIDNQDRKGIRRWTHIIENKIDEATKWLS
ncbi:MAG: hypothetical protein Q9163_002915 [Psora crenata]